MQIEAGPNLAPEKLADMKLHAVPSTVAVKVALSRLVVSSRRVKLFEGEAAGVESQFV